MSPSWLADWDRLTVFFDYPPAIRRAVYTTNAIESLNYSLRKVLKGRSAFPNDESIIKVLFMGLQQSPKSGPNRFRSGKRPSTSSSFCLGSGCRYE